MALRNYEIVMVYSLANGEEAVEALKQKTSSQSMALSAMLRNGVSASLHIQSTMKTMAIM